MSYQSLFSEAKAAYARGENVMEYLRTKGLDQGELETFILFAYDLQSGSYTQAMREEPFRRQQPITGTAIAEILASLGVASVCEAGVGEGTMLKFVKEAPSSKNIRFHGFDLCLSRLFYAQSVVNSNGADIAKFFTADMTAIPLADDSVDAVLTIHAVEPNYGYENRILHELARVARTHVVLIEPDYERASEAQRQRMDDHHYARGLRDHFSDAGLETERDEPWPYNNNLLNQASLFVLKKRHIHCPEAKFQYISPFSHALLEKKDDCYFSEEEGMAFPVIQNIPLLQKRYGIIASKLNEHNQ